MKIPCNALISNYIRMGISYMTSYMIFRDVLVIRDVLLVDYVGFSAKVNIPYDIPTL